MRHILTSLILTIFASTGVKAELTVDTKKIAEKIDHQVRVSGVSKSDLGIWLGPSAIGANNIYELNSEKLFIPASLTKILTAYASFKTFPMSHKFKTQLLTQGKFADDKLNGNLILKGFGDPSFTSESMWVLVNHFVRTGVKEITGDIVVDDTYFDSVRFDNTREPSRVDRAYDAPIGAMSFNWNSVNVYVRPGLKVGAPARIYADPMSSYIKVINRATTAKGKVKNIRVSRIKDDSRPGDTIIVAGTIGIEKEEVVSYKSITEPSFWSGIHLKEFLDQRGITLKGKIVKGKATPEATVLAELEGSDLRKVVTDMMKFSNNYVAEMLTKNISTFSGNKPGNIADGIEQIRKILETNLGFKKEYYSLLNPSGLTRKNRIRPVDLSHLLNKAKSNFKFFPEFIASMPISGIDGTLKEKFSEEVDIRVRAKTGLLNGVSGLAGYIGHPNGETLTFTFIYNGNQGNIDKAVVLFENILKTVISN
ncbi:MAG: D-alanyl-D-alanine carboxypeptidase/D-alanyl-D-alanine-endopeptidase [Bdellovibrionales bacterium]|nr:D-alanyl-D-alanine carboxypeptidase/D-alanyl-D-alanine-endopeptidase [Bdellovibrionales bacterium]